MKRTIQLTALAAVMAGAAIASTGCQNAGRRDDTNRSVTVAGTYDRAYVATRDTEWMATPTSTPQAITRGTRVYFSEGPTANDTQMARVEGLGVGYVHPTHFAKESR
jgi:hypothetical protein